jgi:signal peptidase
MKRAVLLLLAIVLIVAAPQFIKQQFSFLPVTGISMAPVLEEGDLIVCEKVSPDDIQIGDIIIYNVPSTNQRVFDYPPVVAHRVVEMRETATGLLYRTRGDNNPVRDPWSVRQSDIIGKVSQQISFLGFPLLFLKSCPGTALIILIFLASAICFYFDELRSVGRKNLIKIFARITGESRRGSCVMSQH